MYIPIVRDFAIQLIFRSKLSAAKVNSIKIPVKVNVGNKKKTFLFVHVGCLIENPGYYKTARMGVCKRSDFVKVVEVKTSLGALGIFNAKKPGGKNPYNSRHRHHNTVSTVS